MIKKLLFVALAFIFVQQASAQLEKGKLYLDVTLGKRIVNYSANSFNPSLSVAISKHSSIGAFFDYTRYKNFYNGDKWGYINKYSYGVTYNYYSYFNQKNKGSGWGWFVNGSAAYNQFDTYLFETATGDRAGDMVHKEVSLSVTPGIFFQPNKRVMLHASIGGGSLYWQDGRRGLHGQTDIGKRIDIGATIKLSGLFKKKK